MSINMAAHLREPKHTCLGRTGASVTSPAHLRNNLSEVTNSGNHPNTAVLSPIQQHAAIRLLEAIRHFTATWEQHESLIPRWENEEEAAARKAARDALSVVEDCAQWLAAEMEEM